MKNILLIGGPGSGKGTLGTFLSNELDGYHISTGELFRFHMSNNTELGLQVKEAINAGGLAPDDLTVGMMKDKIDVILSTGKEASFIFDGFPRNIQQGPLLKDLLDEYDMELNIVFYLNATDDVMTERLNQRANKEDRPEDANPEYCQKRIAVFHEQTTPLIDFYKEKGILVEIDASMSIEEIRTKVMSELE